MKPLFLKMIFLFQLILSNKKKLVVTALVGGLAGILYAKVHEPLYVAEVSFAVYEKTGEDGTLLSLGLVQK